MKRHLLALLGFALVIAAIVAPRPADAANLSLDGKLSLQASTATASSNAATCANKACIVTSESLTTAAAATYTVTVTATPVAATDLCLASVAYGTATAGVPVVTRVTPGSGSLVIIVQNNAAAAAFDGTIKITYVCLKP